MDPIINPYAPGAGTQPPALAGRDAVLDSMRIALGRIRLGRSAKSCVLVGLRGVGKTVLLDRIRRDAEGTGIHTCWVEAPEHRSLPAVLAPQLRQALLRLSRTDRAAHLATRALRGLAGFATSLKVKYGDIEVGLDLDAEPGLADNGDLELDLQDLLQVVGEAAKGAETAVAIFMDEMQYVPEEQLAALITALHRCAQRQLPVTLAGAGLPQLRGRMGKAKSYAERLFNYPEIGPLPVEAARDALVIPAAGAGVEFDPGAVARIIRLTQGYPYFLQEWGKQVWEVADASPISESDVECATQLVTAALDEGFFRVRFDRLTPTEGRYLRAMAELGVGPYRSGDIAAVLGRDVTQLGPVRAKLVEKGMIWSPAHGVTEFTVPLFDEFMRRIMPGADWLG